MGVLNAQPYHAGRPGPADVSAQLPFAAGRNREDPCAVRPDPLSAPPSFRRVPAGTVSNGWTDAAQQRATYPDGGLAPSGRIVIGRCREEAQVCRMPRARDQPAHVRAVDEQVVVGAELGYGLVAPVGQQAVAAAGQVEPKMLGDSCQVDLSMAEDVHLGTLGGEHLSDHPVVAFPAAHRVPEPVVDGGPQPAGWSGPAAVAGGRAPFFLGTLVALRGHWCGHRDASQVSSSRWPTAAVRVIARRRPSITGSSRR